MQNELPRANELKVRMAVVKGKATASYETVMVVSWYVQCAGEQVIGQ